MSQILSDNILINLPKILDDKMGVFASGVWRPYNNAAEFTTRFPPIGRAEGQMFWVRNAVTPNNADLYAVRADKSVYKVFADIDLSNYYTISQIDGLLVLKADLVYVNSSLALKADITYVDAEILEEKTARQNADLLKADLTYVDDNIANLQANINASASKTTANIYGNGTNEIQSDELIGVFVQEVTLSGVPKYTIDNDNAPNEDTKTANYDDVLGVITLPITVDADNFITAQYSGMNGENASVAKAISDNFILSEVVDLVGDAYSETAYPSAVLDADGIFSGWDTPIGVKEPFNRIVFKIETQATSPTLGFVRITETNNAGAILGEVDLGALSLAPDTLHEIVVNFPTTIDSPETLRLIYKFNQPINRYGILTTGQPYPVPPNARSSYKVNGVVSDWVFVNSSSSVRANYAKCYLTQGFVYKPTQTLLDNIEDGIPELQQLPDVIEKVNRSIEFTDFFEGVEVFAKSTAIYPYTASTYSGWGFPIGVQSGDTIRFPLKSRPSGITRAKWELRKVDKDGDLLYSGDMALSIPPSTYQEVLAKLGEVFENEDDDQLWFGYKCDQQCDVFGIITGFAFPYPAFGKAAYVGGGNVDGTYINIAGQLNGWCEIGTSSEVVAPTDEFLASIQREIIIPDPDNVLIPYAEVILPSRIPCLEGLQTNLYFANFIDSNIDISLLNIDVVCNRGKHQAAGWQYTPIAADSGTIAISINVYFEGTLLTSYSGTLRIGALSTNAGLTVKMNNLSDSTFATGQPQTAIIAEQTAGSLMFTFEGGEGVAPNKHEGHSGFKISDFATAGRTYYKFPVTGLGASPSLGAIYSIETGQYIVREINITGGSGYFNTERTSGSINPPANGTLTRVSGSGPATIDYVGSTVDPGGVLWNPGTQQCDYAYYLAQKGITMSAGDLTAMHLGINDDFAFLTDAGVLDYIETQVTDTRTIINSVHSAVSGGIFLLMIPICPAISQGAFGDDYNSGQTLARYLRNIRMWQKRMILEFDNATERTARNFLVPFNAVVDRVNSFSRALVPAHSRVIISNTYASVTAMNADLTPANRILCKVTNGVESGIDAYFIKVGATTTGFWRSVTQDDGFVLQYLNAVHPTQIGYNQMSDSMRASAETIKSGVLN